MAKFKKKNAWKSMLALVFGVLFLAGSVVGLASLFNRNVDRIGASAFSVGGLDPETGKFIDRMDTLYTVSAFSAQGLKITPDFQHQDVEYQIFFYDENDRFLEATEILSGSYAEQQLLPTYARIVVYPSTLDDEGNLIEDYKLDFWGIRKILKTLTITVDVDQDKRFSENLFVEGEDGISAVVEIEDFDGLLLHLPSATVTDSKYTVTFFEEKKDATGNIVMKKLDDVIVSLRNYSDGEFLWYTVDSIPEGATHLTITYYDNNVNVGVYGIN